MLDVGIDLISPRGEAMANMMATFAQLERSLIGEPTKAALAANKAQGVTLGRLRMASTAVTRRIVETRARA